MGPQRSGRRFGGCCCPSPCLFLLSIRSSQTMDPAIDPKLLEDPIFRRVLADSLSIQDRFSAEPVFARTGKGFLKSEGVEGLERIRSESKGGKD